MTKREFDAATKEDYGQAMPSDTCEAYRDGRHQVRRYGSRTWDRLAVRATYRAQVTSLLRRETDRLSGALVRGSKLRTPLRWRMRGRIAGKVAA